MIGYANRLSARPGEEIEFKISSTSDKPYQADLIQIICADPNPNGPGIIHNDLKAEFAGEYPSRPQGYQLGSYVQVEHADRLKPDGSFTLAVTVWPTAIEAGRQCVIGGYDAGLNRGVSLSINAKGLLEGRIGRREDDPLIAVNNVPLRNKYWYRLWLCYDAKAQSVQLGQIQLDPGHEPDVCEQDLGEPLPLNGISVANPLFVACEWDHQADQRYNHFNGKIEAPAIFSTVTDMSQEYGPDNRDCLAFWDFSEGISTLEVTDKGPLGLRGSVVNLPTRGMTGSRWHGQEMCWRHAPELYGAIHFHDDDFYDCDWETDFTFEIPANFRSGVYAVRMRCGEYEDTIPFFVCAPKGKKQADLCVLISTFTYLIYSNNARYDYGTAIEQRMAEWGAYPWNPERYSEYGLSAYNLHSDGSGINTVSGKRPLLTLKSGYLTLLAPGCGSGLRHFQADSHLLAWLAHQDIEFDVITDDELHNDGVDALKPYKALVTGTHPEYHTAESLNAVRDYRDGGGRIAYLGGNGFYWRVALHGDAPGAIEIRRGEGGIRTWAAEPGEYYNAFDGNYGGLWRRNGRTPQSLVGIGFSAQGTFLGSYFRRTEDSHNPELAWIFNGIEDEILGDFGFSGGGAAGYELDRFDPALGSPENTVVVARSEKHADTYVPAFEELLTHVSTVTGETHEQLIRADMIYVTFPGGGEVFSTGSITFCGSLPHNNFNNNISHLLLNVVNRFAGL